MLAVLTTLVGDKELHLRLKQEDRSCGRKCCSILSRGRLGLGSFASWHRRCDWDGLALQLPIHMQVELAAVDHVQLGAMLRMDSLSTPLTQHISLTETDP